MTLPGKKINSIDKDILVPIWMSEPAFETLPMHERQKRFDRAKAVQHNLEVEED